MFTSDLMLVSASRSVDQFFAVTKNGFTSMSNTGSSCTSPMTTRRSPETFSFSRSFLTITTSSSVPPSVCRVLRDIDESSDGAYLLNFLPSSSGNVTYVVAGVAWSSFLAASWICAYIDDALLIISSASRISLSEIRIMSGSIVMSTTLRNCVAVDSRQSRLKLAEKSSTTRSRLVSYASILHRNMPMPIAFTFRMFWLVTRNWLTFSTMASESAFCGFARIISDGSTTLTAYCTTSSDSGCAAAASSGGCGRCSCSELSSSESSVRSSSNAPGSSLASA
ncbi:hypothetical protein OGATHE_003394 [Ogataea polymorpha]|uniref:Uncharacterized protein n=1 Tax=Ogataea polymorpha TaxID=460523 RepID=A0A9P8T3V3_9ASCO|nr:hypothetical protein OGATHE_003394 [Ogataea polymorpha]